LRRGRVVAGDEDDPVVGRVVAWSSLRVVVEAALVRVWAEPARFVVLEGEPAGQVVDAHWASPGSAGSEEVPRPLARLWKYPYPSDEWSWL